MAGGAHATNYPFSVTTTGLNSGDTFTFTMSAKGTFDVDCGTGGILSGTGVSGTTIDRSSTTDDDTYTCTYSSGGPKTVQFDGLATGYYNGTDVPVIRFTTPTLITSLVGNLSTIFPWAGFVQQLPRFVSTFEGATNLHSVPATLFASYTTGAQYMFWNTFKGCTGLTQIPAGLFSGITALNTSIPQAVFFHTFEGCTGLISIPEDLFLGIRNNTSGSPHLFNSTFLGCTGLTSIPANLFHFNSNVTGKDYMFAHTFEGCSGLISLPNGLFSSFTTAGQGMFIGTFRDCTSLESIPENLFGNNNMSGVNGLFSEVFRGCTSLTTIPAGLFSHITSGAQGMFNYAFSFCTGLTSIPSNLFSFGGNDVAGAVNMFAGVFYGCTSLTSIPDGLFSHITSADTGMFQSAFSGCTGLNGNGNSTQNFIPPTLFSGLINNNSPTANALMNGIFFNTSLRTTCPVGYYQYITGYESNWSNKVSCSPCPNGMTSTEGATSVNQCFWTITYYDRDCTTVLSGLEPSTYKAGDTVVFPTATKPGYTNSGWCRGCGTSCGAIGWSSGLQVTGNQSIYVSGWTGNTIPVNFDETANNCTFGGDLGVPASPSRTGYVFLGWNLCSLSDLDTSIGNSSESYYSINGANVCFYNDAQQQSCSQSAFDDLSPNEWKTIFGYGTVYGKAKCSDTTLGTGPTIGPGTPSNTSGQYCWCKATGYKATGEQKCNFDAGPWVMSNTLHSNTSECETYCPRSCGSRTKTNQTFRNYLYGQAE